MDVEIIENKKDIGRLSERAHVLKVKCALEHKDAVEITKRCRLLEEVVFNKKAYMQTENDAKEYFNKWFYIEVE